MAWSCGLLLHAAWSFTTQLACRVVRCGQGVKDDVDRVHPIIIIVCRRTRPHHRCGHVLDGREQYAGRDCDHLAAICPSQQPAGGGYDPFKPNSWITYLDANNLYGTAMSEPLPEGNFRFLSQDEISDFDLMDVPTHGDTGYIVECDLKYPRKTPRTPQ